MYLGELIKKYRTENKISQRDFAKLCDLSHTYISALEKNFDSRTGKPIAPTLDCIKSIAKAMNMPIGTILHLLEENTQEFMIRTDTPNSPEYYKINVEGLTQEDIEELKQFVDFIRNKKKHS